MSKMLFDFQCSECNTVEELFVTSDTQHYTCADCTGVMNRVISGTSFVLDGTDPGFPTAYAGWEKKRLSKKD